MKRTISILSLLVLAFAIVGCSKKNTDNNEAVKQGVIKYLSKRSDLAAMDVSVASVQFRGDEADAKVHFQAKNNTNPAASLDMTYVLERKGKEWEVKGRSGAGAASSANPHGAGGGGMPPAGGAMPQGSLPAGHPEIPPGAMPQGSAPKGSLPPGHPAIPSGAPPKSGTAQPGMPELPQIPPHK